MITSKRFTSVAMIVVTILLVVGNWVTPAQANNASIITPTPTGTPITDLYPAGKPVSAELEKELKAHIWAYFEIRYDALSISHPYGFRPDGFGNLVSDGVDAQGFVHAELDKLALEIKYAELNRSRYVDYKYFLNFSNFTMNVTTQFVAVSVIENNEIIYEISAKNNPANPHAAQMSGLKHTIILHNEQGQWRIVSDHYNDFLWRTMRQTGESVEETLNRLDTMEAPQVTGPSGENAGAETASLLPDDASSHAYDRVGAVNYAVAYAAAANYNLNYPSYDDGNNGDCTNFVSQALYEGGNISMYIPPGPLPPPGLGGQSGWYLLNDMQRATDWNWVDGFYTFVTNYAPPSEGPEGYELGPVPEGQVPVGLMLGDVIQYERQGDNSWDHAAIVVDFDVNGDPIVASHSPNNPGSHFMTIVQHVKTRFIHIERSDGYPPVKAQTTSAADDAGGNPSGTCPGTNSDPGNNYLGGCFNGSTGVTSGFLFRNIQIPQGAQIKYAFVTFTTDGTYVVNVADPGVYAPISLQIYGENSATPADFSSTNTPTQRTILTTSIPWPINGTNVAYDTWYWKGKRTTPAITSIIQSITSLPNWVFGNTLSLIFQNGLPGDTHARRVIALEGIPLGYSPARLIAAYDLTTTNLLSVNSVAAQDGWILESNETSNEGGSNNLNATYFLLGDNATNRQYRSILHFDTTNLPDTAVITSVTLRIKQQGSIIGTNPFTTHGSLLADIQRPFFGSTIALVKGDFQAMPGQSMIATFNATPVGGWYSASLISAGFPYINLTGATQFRLNFSLDDDNDRVADNIAFSSGDDTMFANRPQLIIYYYIP